jgi:hypothetical protein
MPVEEKKEKDFVVRDRRISPSGENGDSQEQRAGAVGDKDKKEAPAAERAPERGQENIADRKEESPLPELDFASFLLSLATTAQVSLGAVPNPQTNLTAQNLPAAKQMIDIIGMLKEKTKSNLTQEEQALIDSILFNLRMQYVRALEGKK